MTDADYRKRLEDLNEQGRQGLISPAQQVLAMAMENDRPTEVPCYTDASMTSTEIADRMSDIISITVNEVAEVMLALGYRLYVDILEGPLWSIAPRHSDNNNVNSSAHEELHETIEYDSEKNEGS